MSFRSPSPNALPDVYDYRHIRYGEYPHQMVLGHRLNGHRLHMPVNPNATETNVVRVTMLSEVLIDDLPDSETPRPHPAARGVNLFTLVLILIVFCLSIGFINLINTKNKTTFL